ncbi:MAG: 30S ribosomal protein S11 [Microgenomates group bacterium ADurb.Bin219]|nr:MAG: 30S ribosomal protein S11 [Microgenomates group bacterium ADurb.Bin219]HNP89197.1 30S ribosomal protein S11 [Candidatus Woesebacteria bacterium]
MKKSNLETKTIEKAQIHVAATFNNTLVAVTDTEGKVLTSLSSGAVGFKGARKATPFAATVTVEKALEKVRNLGIKSVEIFIKGPGAGRDAALRAIRAANFKIDLIGDVTPIPHNGCRPKKRRRM